MAELTLRQTRPGTTRRATAWWRALVDRLPAGEARGDLLWAALWLPYWLASEVATPERPARDGERPARLGLAGEVVVAGLDRVRRRLWVQHALSILVRALWLGPAVGCLWIVVELVGGPAMGWRPLIGLSAGLVALGLIFACLSRPSRRRTARMLDRSFDLKERLTTALDHLGRGVPREGERATVVYLQMADAANAVSELRRQRSLGVLVPVRELVLAVFWGLLLAALFFFRGVGGDLPRLTAGAVPRFTPAVERPPEPEPVAQAVADAQAVPSIEDVMRLSERSSEAQRDLQALAGALDDHAVTRSAADAISRGDYEAAAGDLRDLAPNADQLSPAAREELARDLDQAATEMSPGSTSLSQATSDAAEGLRQGGDAARAGVDQLGDAVEQTGGEVASQQELAERLRQAQGADGNQGDGGTPGDSSAASSPLSELLESMMNEGQASSNGSPQRGRPGQPGSGQPQTGEGQPGEGADQGGQPGPPGAMGGQPGAGPPGGQPGETGAEGAGSNDDAGDGPRAERGGGAGSGEAGEESRDGGMPAAAGGEAGEGGPASEEQVVGGSGAEADAGDPRAVSNTIQLPSSPGGQAIQTGNDAGSASRGSGTGATGGTGSVVQGEVGEAGPDSNRVPPDYRPIVERYFSDSDGE